MNFKNLYLILPALAGVMFGSSGYFVRTLTSIGFNSTTLLFVRFSIAIFVMLIAILFTDKTLLKVNKRDLVMFLFAGISILGLNIFYNNSINTVPLSVAAVLLSTAPVFVITFSFIVFNEKITTMKLVCMIFTIIGCVLASGLLEESLVSISLFGIISGIIAATFYGFYSMTSEKSLNEGKHVYTILFYSLIFITLILIPFTDFNTIQGFILTNPSHSILFLITHSVVSFALPYIFWTVSLNYVDSGISAILLSGCEPIAAMFIGLIVYLEFPSFLMFLGVIITIIALIFLSKSSNIE